MRDLALRCGHFLNRNETFAMHLGEKWCPSCRAWVLPVGECVGEELQGQETR